MHEILADILRALEKYRALFDFLGTFGFAGFLHYSYSRFKERERIRVHSVEVKGTHNANFHIMVELENTSSTVTSLLPLTRLRSYSLIEHPEKKAKRTYFERLKVDRELPIINKDRTLQPFSPTEYKLKLPSDWTIFEIGLLRFPRIKLTTARGKTITIRMIELDDDESPKRFSPFWLTFIRDRPWKRRKEFSILQSQKPDSPDQTGKPS